VREALLTHRSAYLGDVLNRDNLFYIPPELLLDAHGGPGGKADWMCQQVLRVLRAEQARDVALAEQRYLAEQLAVMNHELERRVAQRTAELEVANRHLESFSYSVSHDLRAPLRAIRSFGVILKEEFAQQLDDEGRSHLERVCGAAHRMEELIDGLLSMGRIVNSPLNRKGVDLTALTHEVVGELRRADPQRSVDVIVHEGLAAAGDPILVRAALVNLVSNAWKFTSKRERARIEVGKQGDEKGHPIFFVRDNGAGFDMEYSRKLFGVFQRLHGQEFPGHGIGLATVERIISRHGGRIWPEGRPGEGATFFFTLPEPEPEPVRRVDSN
jgi:light-regulated signal transduction histidine kinase (bacteriophytochrome)